MMTFEQFFEAATGHARYDYQWRLAGGDGGRLCQSQLINIPTGLGKTAAVVLAWLWNRVAPSLNSQPSTINQLWPRRLVYCLPMRTLVEQTRDNVAEWVVRLAYAAAPADENVAKAAACLPKEAQGRLKQDDTKLSRYTCELNAARNELLWLVEHSPVVLMGGEELEQPKREWDLYPERPCILIGTQDMLLSRALNRGYGMSRYRWPMHFGLLNNDALWVLDETQLMGPGLSTACQLEAFRAPPAQGFGSCGEAGSVTWYMSATGSREHLKTRDWRQTERRPEFEIGLGTEEKAATAGAVYQRRSAVKRLEPKPASSFEDLASTQSLIPAILSRHEEMVKAIGGGPKLPSRTLIICNTLDRAASVHARLAAEKPEGCDVLLLHSRFRPPERRAQMERLERSELGRFPKGQIVVATQVIEAGVDVSSGILWSEIAPLASLVQRLGRLNRAGEFNESAWKPAAIVVGAGIKAVPQRETNDEKKKREEQNAKLCLPYELKACEDAWKSLEKLEGDASPANLETIQDAIVASIPRCPYSLQSHELLDFFDTDANLSLGFTDVSPFVRGLDEDADLQLCWREPWSEDDGPPNFSPDYQRDELCSVPISKAKNAREVLNRGWLWRGKESGWISMRDYQPVPGMTILLPLTAGGYDHAKGWTGNRDDNKHASHYQPQFSPSDEEQLSSLANGWRSIAVHAAEVGDELRRLLNHLLAAPDHRREYDAFLTAFPWHDIGKNHSGWQQAVLTALNEAGITGKEGHQPFAKFSLSDSPSLIGLKGEALKKRIREVRNSFRPGIAHEVASALAFRQAEQDRLGRARDTDLASLLVEYVIISHHGRVRKVLRDELPRLPKNEKDTHTVRGISDGDSIPAVEIEGRSLGCDVLSTDCRKMGRAGLNGYESYTRGVLRLLDHYGPFRLAFFEGVFRAADIRASINASRTANL